MLSPRSDHSIQEEHQSELQTTLKRSSSHTAYDSLPSITIHPPPETSQESSSSSIREERNMSSGSVRRESGSSSRRSSRSKTKKDDWSDIVDPEDRRRVQNKLAQRKFRGKAKEARERNIRDAENHAQARNAYTPADPSELSSPSSLAGLPWGSGFSMPHVIARGQAAFIESRHGSQSQQHSNDRSPQSQDGYSPYQLVAETFEEHEYKGDAVLEDSEPWPRAEESSYFHHYGGEDPYYHDDGGDSQYGSVAHQWQ